MVRSKKGILVCGSPYLAVNIIQGRVIDLKGFRYDASDVLSRHVAGIIKRKRMKKYSDRTVHETVGIRNRRLLKTNPENNRYINLLLVK